MIYDVAMTPIAPAQLLDTLHWRYATKVFDATRTIPAATWDALERSLVLTPSSYGLQPWKFIVITDKALREQLRPVSWNQAQVTDCSHHVVFCGRTEMHEQDVQRLIDATAAQRGIPAAAIDGYKGMMLKDVVHGPRGKIAAEWAARQCYIALGQFMLACAEVGVDACPMEGFDPAKYDQILGLAGTGYRSVVACPAGYRAAGDKYAQLAKVRFPVSEVVERR
jgi:nitroreductase